jgi:hypothetical protein
MNDLSIHPRNYKGGNKVKLNTAEPYKNKTTRLAKKKASLNRRQIACETTRKMPHVNPESFKMPGSMKGH